MDDKQKQYLIDWHLDIGVSEIICDTPQGFINCENENANNELAYNTLSELKKAIEQLKECPLRETALNMVFSDGNPKAKIMFVGEAPGADEDKQGKPFVGVSGQLLDKMLNAIGFNRENVYIANIIPYRPPGNRTPTTNEIAFFLPYIKKHIELINPGILVLLGGVALKALIGKTDGIMRIRGQWIKYENIPFVIATYHPAFLLRSPGRKKEAWHDFLRIKEKSEITNI